MPNTELVIRRDQRDEIVKAVKAIERQLVEMAEQPRTQTLWTIGLNLSLIQSNLTNLPGADST